MRKDRTRNVEEAAMADLVYLVYLPIEQSQLSWCVLDTPLTNLCEGHLDQSRPSPAHEYKPCSQGSPVYQ